jgi:signal transduction histidine kinase
MVPGPRWLALASVALLLILCAGATAISVRAYLLYEAARSTETSVIDASDSLLIELLNAETGQRGYLLTNRLIYLQPYQKALAAVPADQERLALQISAVPGGGPDLARLNTLAAAKLAELSQTISLARAGNRAGALQIVDTNEGKHIMDQARRVIAGIQRATAAASAARRSDLKKQLILSAGLAAILGIIVVAVFIILLRRVRRGAEQVRSLNAMLERRVRQRTRHLQVANEDMEAFNYSVAHDLRTPLRGISGYAEALVVDYGDRLDETGREYAARVQAGCARMASLMDDLLALSRVTQARMNLQDVDLSAEVTAICGQLRARDPGRQVKVSVEDGVRATADRPLIRAALEHLLDNAWKFTAGRDDAAIEFATTIVEDAPVCCYVGDNGIGFDPIYVAKLFQPFQRLHDASEFPGSGIGLASVQRIIQRHGGRAWAEAAVGGGASFYFTLNATGTS